MGDRAPEVELADQHGSMFRLSAMLGKGPMVLCFYPKDDTPVCTREACTFRDRHDEFTGLGATVFGISDDGAASHKRFAGKHRLPFTLLSDVDGAARKAFGLRARLGFQTRVAFVIGADGIIRAVVADRLNATRHVREALGTLRVQGVART